MLCPPVPDLSGSRGMPSLGAVRTRISPSASGVEDVGGERSL